MTTIPGRSATALLVIDVQAGVVSACHDRDAVVGRIATLVDGARAANMPVVWVQHCSEEFVVGSDAWQIVSELTPAEGEPRILKRFGDSFENTTLSSSLEQLGVGHLVVCGAQTDACVRCTLHGALARGYDVTLASDAHTTEDMREWGSPISAEDAIAYTNLYWSFTGAPGRTTGVTAAADIAW